MRIRFISLAITLLATLALAPGAWAATTFTVGGIGDGGDANTADGICAAVGGTCTLRAAIEQSNVASAGTPHTINLAPISGQTLTPATSLPAITRDRTFIDGCGVGREITQDLGLTGLPKPPASNPCVGLSGAGVLATGLRATGTDGVYVQGLAVTGFQRGIHLWGADGSHIGGNWFGLRRDGTTAEANGIGISVTGRTSGADPATENFVGGASSANDDFAPACNAYCNLIVSSSGAGVDLGGSDSGDIPAGGACGAFTCGNFVQGNWIGVASADGTVVHPNAAAVTLGNSDDTEIGGFATDEANVIAGNTKGVDQSAGTGKPWLLGGTYGISPDGNLPVPNTSGNASLGGSNAPGGGAFVSNVTFGPSDIGLELLGPQARVVSSTFRSPDPTAEQFGTAAIRIGPDADNAFIGSNLAAAPVCIPGVDLCNVIKDTAVGAAGIWVDGASDTRIWRNAIGGGIAQPIAGTPIRVTGAAVRADIGDSDDDPDTRNFLGRVTGPAIEVGGSATGVVIGDNEGRSLSTLGPPSGLFTDLLPSAGPGNVGPVNNGILPPAVTVSSTVGVGGTGIPGAKVHVLLQERGTDENPPVTYIETALPPTPSTAVVRDDGSWGFEFPTPLTGTFKLLASQTTPADGTSEYSEPVSAVTSNPPPIVTFQSGPSGVVETRAATFTFSSNKPGTRLTCSVDAGAFVPCSSPFTLNGLDIGGHQLQVKGTDPTGKVGAPASRTWIVQIPEPVAPGGGAPPAKSATAGKIRFSSVVSLPSARRCISRRTLRITVRTPKGAKVRSAEVRIGKRKVGSSRKARTIPVSLKGLPSGRFVVRVKVTLTDGRVISGSRAYRTCAKKAKKR